MASPETNELYHPLLLRLADGGDCPKRTLDEYVAQSLQVPPEELQRCYKATGLNIFKRRVLWCIRTLVDAHVIERTGYATYRLTASGLALAQEVKAGKVCVNHKYICNLPEYRETTAERHLVRDDSLAAAPVAAATASAQRGPAQPVALPAAPVIDERTPEDMLEAACASLNERLEEELLRLIREQPPGFLERLAVDLLEKMGYARNRWNETPNKPTQSSRDGGLDAIFYEDKLGFNAIYVQAKRFSSSSVGRPDVQAFVGAMAAHSCASKGLFITTSNFSADAVSYAERQYHGKLVLVNGRRLVRLMLDCGLGVSAIRSYTVHQIDTDYFDPDGVS